MQTIIGIPELHQGRYDIQQNNNQYNDIQQNNKSNMTPGIMTQHNGLVLLCLVSFVVSVN
jgi:hypothetical protein